MKPNPEMLFGNIFDDNRITPNYLGRCADDVVAKLIQNNGTNEYDTVLNPLQASMIPFRSELGQVDTTLNIQVGKTATVDSFILNFKAYMNEKYMPIAVALGNDKTPAFKEFYPQGKTEYTQLTKTKIPTVMERLKTAAINNQTAIGAVISGELQAFQNDWILVRKTQLEGKAAVKTNRSDRTTARKEVEIALLKTIHFVADKYPADVLKCKTFFDFNLLFGARHKSLEDAPPLP
jgi:hypothetical protein